MSTERLPKKEVANRLHRLLPFVFIRKLSLEVMSQNQEILHLVQNPG
jgi:hypothetical protein